MDQAAETPPPHTLDPILRPRGVAVIGASSDPSKRGFQALRALGEAGFHGSIYPVNPKGGEILGHPVVESASALPPGVDLALVCTPSTSAPEVLEECARAGIRAAVVLAVGFGEAGEEGARVEGRVAEVAAATGIRVVGPNTSGILNLSCGLNLIGARGVRPGPIGLLVQSGNIALNFMLEASRRSRTGLSVCVGVGNEVDVGFHEFLDFLAADPHTRVIVLHAEGFRNGPAFLAAAAAATRVKPVLLLKGGRSESGAAAARSHTGAVAGAHELLSTAVKQAGVLEVGRTDELFHLAEMLANQAVPPAGTGVGILSDGGGQGTLAADYFAERGVPLAALGTETKAKLRELLGMAAAVGNPVDLAGRADTDPVAFAQAIEVLAADPEVGPIVVIGLFGGYGLRFAASLAEGEMRAAEGMVRISRGRAGPLIVHTMYAPEASAPLDVLREGGLPVVESLEVACGCAAAALERAEAMLRPRWMPAAASPRNVRAREGASRVLARGRNTGAPVSARPGSARPGFAGSGFASSISASPATPPPATHDAPDTWLNEPDARALLAGFGVPMSHTVLCATADEAVEAALGVGPVAVRVVAEGVVHKTEVGGVRLGVEGEDEVRGAFEAVVSAAAPHGTVLGALVGPMLPRPSLELLLGIRRDPTVGPVLTVGQGGVLVEILRDVAHRALPVAHPSEFEAMIRELDIGPLIFGYRRMPPLAIDALRDAMAAMARCALERPDIREAEVNPLFVYADRVEAVDARVLMASDL